MPWKAKDYTGRTFGFLTGIKRVGTKQPGYRALWLFRCVCGKNVERVANTVVNNAKVGQMPSCGCMEATTRAKAQTVHGMSKHPAYKIWEGMKKRCSPNTHTRATQHYRDKGVRVCERWLKWEAFWEDMGPTWEPGLTLDRIDYNGDYCPQNCRWATWKEQQNNRSTNHLIGEETLTQFATRHGLKASTVRMRIKRGWPEYLLGAPLHTRF